MLSPQPASGDLKHCLWSGLPVGKNITVRLLYSGNILSGRNRCQEIAQIVSLSIWNPKTSGGQWRSLSFDFFFLKKRKRPKVLNWNRHFISFLHFSLYLRRPMLNSTSITARQGLMVSSHCLTVCSSHKQKMNKDVKLYPYDILTHLALSVKEEPGWSGLQWMLQNGEPWYTTVDSYTQRTCGPPARSWGNFSCQRCSEWMFAERQ